jgi:site-specific recombinase XerD
MHLLQAGVDITVIALWLGHALCLFRAVTYTVMASKCLSGFQQKLAVGSMCCAAGMA